MKTLLLTAIAPIVWGSTYIVTTEALPPNSPLMASLGTSSACWDIAGAV